jgi:hypothetical protein
LSLLPLQIYRERVHVELEVRTDRIGEDIY